jgi:hypothetical protein
MWINVQTALVESEYAIRRNNPDTSYPTPMPESIPRYAWAVPDMQPAAQPWCTVSMGAPAFVGNQWTLPWVQTPMTDNQIIEAVKVEVQARLDTFAQTRGYDTIGSASEYAGCSVVKFSSEGQRAKDLRAATWDALYTIMAAVQTAQRPMPASTDALMAELPALAWV